MKLLVVGCSFSSGWGFSRGKDSADIWPNLLGADVTNLSVTGTDNTGIFLNTLLADPTKFDQVIVQWTGLDRVIVGNGMVSENNPLPGILTNADYKQFHKSFLILNNQLHHWTRFCQLVTILQKHTNIYFINGLIGWNKDMFSPNLMWNHVADNIFLRNIIDSDQLTDEQIQETWDIVKSQISKIDLTKWINPFNSLQSSRIDQVGADDMHPGRLSHRRYAELIGSKIHR